MRFYEHHSVKARWSFRIATLCVLAAAATFIWHRFFGLPTPLALKVFYGAVILAVTALTLATAALVEIWNEGSLGAGKASFAILLSLGLLAVPAASLPNLMRLPRLYEVTTDPANPPAFNRVAKIRQGAQANPVLYNATFAPLQTAAYPDIKPLLVARPLADAYAAVRETVKALNWKVINEQSPETAKTGYIEAADRTWLFGFTGDTVIRVTRAGRAAKIDIRSSSRFGQHDLGRNAARIRVFLSGVKERLASIERAERMERLIASRDKAAAKANRKRSSRSRR